MNAKEYVHHVSAQRVSSNFPREVVYGQLPKRDEADK
jgi:hypothetical protein